MVALAHAGAEEEERLEKIRSEIEAREARAREFASEAKGYLGELEAIDRELVETRKSLARLRKRRGAAEEELQSARTALRDAERARTATERDLGTRLVALYKFRATGGLPALASAGDFQSFARLQRGLSAVLQQDAVLFGRYREAELASRFERDRSASLVAELAATGSEIKSREDRTRRKLVERTNLVELLRSRADREHKAAGELREAAERLEQALRELPEGRSVGQGLALGRVPAPVRGALRLAFGLQVEPEFGTETLRTGVEFAAPEGAPVRAVAPGRVLFAGWFRGYGQMVILDHGKGSLTVSGYLGEMAVAADDSVAAGQLIGSVGRTGTLGEPGLYFEIRKDGQAVDPERWLR
jgi:septal ring factor EnvC (AmiA/AmiB activator)